MRPRHVPLLAGLLALAGGAAPASAAQPPGAEGGLPYRDVRDGARAEAVARSRTEDEAPVGQDRAAAALVRREGALASLTTDPTTGTVRVLLDAGGALSGPSDDGPVRTALGYVRAHLAALGLTATDLDTLDLQDVTTSTDGVTHVRWRQVIDGVRAFDNGLSVDLDRGGRVLTVTGAPIHAPELNRTDPVLGADDALRVVGGDGTGADSARLVVFDVNGLQRLAWRVRHRESSTADYDAVVDAVTGRLLHRANLVKFAWKVFPHYPGAPPGGGTQISVDLAPYLTSATTLTGNFARAYADLDDNDRAGTGEETDPSAADGTFTPAAGTGCTPSALCSWDGTPGSWPINQDQNAIQAFWFVNAFHDHLASSPIGFTGFEGASNRVIVNTDDGASTGPDGDHLSNANMSTPPAGQSPRMQMYLFSGTGFRDVNGGDAAEVVYHEYTHGLSNRLVVDSGGSGALNSAQAGAMGEGWSDWYAMDFLTRPDVAGGGGAALITDDPTKSDIDMGAYTDATPNQIRSQPLDCAVSPVDGKCPGSGTAGGGGYTYGDFGKICSCGPEVHLDGEIWGETLWDLRAKLILDLGNNVTAGSNLAEQLVTGAMRLSPPEPSFLDMRNAILAEATALGQPSLRDTIWQVFASRGMGFFAGTVDGADTSPAEDFNPPPSGGSPGQVTGRVTDAMSGRPIAGARIAVGGHTSGETSNVFTTTSGSDGTYTLASLPAGTYRKVLVTTSSGYSSQIVTELQVAAGASQTRDLSLTRDWAALAGGAFVSTDTDATGTDFGCGPSSVIDQSQGVGWSAYNPNSAKVPAPDSGNHLVAGQWPTMTIQLPQPIDVSAFRADPGATCGDDGTATARGYRIETSQDGTTFTTAGEGEFVPGDAGALKTLTPTAGTSAVRFVRLTLLSPQDECPTCSGRDFVDFSELIVEGNAIPHGSLSVPATGVAGQPVTLDASSFTDDGTIATYAWDFDGDGATDATTSTATTSHAYPAAGTFAPSVRATDNSGSSASASSSIAIAAAAVIPVVKRRRPALALPRQTPNRVTLRVTCQNRCAGTARLKVGKALAKRLRLKRWTVGKATLKLRAGTRTVPIAIRKDVLRRMRARHVRAAKLSLAVSVRDANGLRTSFARKPTIRIR